MVSLHDGPRAPLQGVEKLSDAVDHEAQHRAEVDDSRQSRHRSKGVQVDARNVGVALTDLVLGARIGEEDPNLPCCHHVRDG